MDLSAVVEAIARPDESVRAAARELLTSSGRSLGRVGDLAGWLAAAQGATAARPLERVRMLRLSAGPEPAATSEAAAPVAAAEQTTAVVDALAATLGVGVRAVTLPADGDVAGALRSGMSLVDEEVDGGADLLVLADAGPAADVPASALVGLLTRTDAASVTRRGDVIDDAGWMRRCAAVRDTMRRGRPVLGDHAALLACVGGADLAAATGVLLQSAARRTPVVLDGVVTAACALVAQRIAFRANDWWLASHRSPEPAHDRALERLGLEPLLDLGVRQEDGTGALLAVPLVRAAATLSG